MIFNSLFKNIFKYLMIFILCLVPIAVIGAGVYCGFKVYEHKHQQSQNFGTITTKDLYADFDVFDCDLSDAIFYETTTGYEYSTKISKSIKFNGDQQKYNVLVNNKPSDYERSSAGILQARNIINYYDISNNLLHSLTLNIEFKFYQSNVEIILSNNFDKEQYSLFLEYVRFNGLKIRTILSQYQRQEQDVLPSSYTLTFVIDNEYLDVQKVSAGAIIEPPTNIPQKEGYVFKGWTPAIPERADNNYTFTGVYSPITENAISEPFMVVGNHTASVDNLGLWESKIDFELFEGENSLGNYTFNTTCVNEYRTGGMIEIPFNNASISGKFRISAYSASNTDLSTLRIALSLSEYVCEESFAVVSWLENCSIKVTRIAVVNKIVPKTYTITFIGYNNNILSENTYYPYETIEIPTPPTIEGKTFVAWDSEVGNLALSNKIYTAIYKDLDTNLLDSPVIFGLEKASISDDVTLKDFVDFPYKLHLQVCYFESKQNQNYNILNECDIAVEAVSSFTEILNISLGSEHCIIRFKFCYDNDHNNGYVMILSSGDSAYVKEHIKIYITSIEKISN